MQTADTIFAVMQKRGKNGQPIERVYRMLFNRELYLNAYAKLYPNKGAMTPGIDEETVDGMSMDKIDNIINAIKAERYRWNPVRRTYVKKPNGKQRPLGIPTWSDKLLQEVIRFILEAYYDPQFSESSHGFRPQRGCHTALRKIQTTWTGTKWIIEGDISQYFDTIDHQVLIEILGRKIKDNRFIRLIQGLLEAGYLEDWKYNKTYSGTPQGGVLSPLLANIYLDQLDTYVQETLIKTYDKGKTRAQNPEYRRLRYLTNKAIKTGSKELARKLRIKARTLPSIDPNDPNYRRLKYVRYADDFVLGVIGPKSEAEEIKQKIGDFLKKELKLNLSEEKTLITNATQETAKFLGYEIINEQCNTKQTNGRRTANGTIALRVPKDKMQKKAAKYTQNGKPIHLNHLLEDSDYSIVAEYQIELKGLYQYYSLALNVSWLYHLKWIMEESLLKTLAAKHKTSVNAMYMKYATKVVTEEGKTLKCIQVTVAREGKKALIARFGGFSMMRKPFGMIEDQTPKTMRSGHTEILQRLLADKCEICGSTEDVEVHHIRKLAEVQGEKNERTEWKKTMATRRRKTLVVCRNCHRAIHAGKPISTKER